MKYLGFHPRPKRGIEHWPYQYEMHGGFDAMPRLESRDEIERVLDRAKVCWKKKYPSIWREAERCMKSKGGKRRRLAGHTDVDRGRNYNNLRGVLRPELMIECKQ